MQELAAGKFHFEPPSPFTSLDHLVGAGDERRRHVDAKRPGCFHIDHQLEFGRLLDCSKSIRSCTPMDWSVTFNLAAASCASLARSTMPGLVSFHSIATRDMPGMI